MNSQVVFSLLTLVGAFALAVLAIVLLERRRLSRFGLFEDRDPWMAWLPEEKYITIPGFKVRCVQAGQGPKLLFIHGIGASLDVWRYVLEPLSHNFTVIAFDLPGFGLSLADPGKGHRDYGLDEQTERILKILQRLDIKECGLVGSSMGGAIALWLGKLQPQRFAQIAVLCPAVHYTLGVKYLPLLKRLSRWITPLASPSTIQFFLRRAVGRAELADRSSVLRQLRFFKENPHTMEALLGSMKLLADRRLPKGLGQPESEILVLYGETDRLVSRRHIDHYARVAPSAKIQLHPTAGHHPMEDEPVWTIEQLRSFFSNAKKTRL